MDPKQKHFVITANSAPDGAAVFLVNETTWSTDLAKARVVSQESERDRLIGVAQAAQKVVADPYAIDVRVDGATIKAADLREHIRATGPTVAMLGGQTHSSTLAGLGSARG